MYLKSIEVHGFKSFANKIVFEFHNGITGIVGPNGSGKSNVADAVRWVLGEQSARQLRGASMQDVIFSGTESRKALGYAYVAITLDNADRQLPVEYQEVVIARKVYRSGESEYLINGTSCRLKDVTEMFYDTGIGKEGYSIIGQGQIDKILSGKPEDRRELFDEAAGIVKFKRRKLMAQKKLESEKNNLVRVNDILGELEKQAEPLEKQSETAKEYLKKKEELKNLDVNMFLLQEERTRGQLAAIEEKLRIADGDLKETAARYENAKTDYERIQSAMEGLEHEIEEKRQSLSDTSVLKGKLQGEINVLKEQINSARGRDEHLHGRLNVVGEDIAGREEDLKTLLSEQGEVDGKLKALEQTRDEARGLLNSVQEKLRGLGESIENGKNAIIEALNDRASIKTRMGRYDTMLEQIQIRKAELNSKLLRSRTDEEEQEQALGELKENLRSVDLAIEEMENRLTALDEQRDDAEQELAAMDKKFRDAQITYHEAKSRLDSLKNLTERYDGYGNSIRRVMELKDTEKGLVGVVADIIQAEKKYEVAIETALGGNIQNIVTSDEETAKRVIGQLKKNKWGRATFLPLTSVRGRGEYPRQEVLSERGVVGLADGLVRVDEKYRAIAGHLLGAYVVVDNIENATAIARKYKYSLRIVTLEGEHLTPGGAIAGGAFKNSSNLLGRRRELAEMEERVRGLLKSMDVMLAQIEDVKEKKAGLRQEQTDLKSRLQEQYILQNTAKMSVSQAEERREETLRSFTELTAESSELENQIGDIRENKEAIQKELAASEKAELENSRLVEEWTVLTEQVKQEEGERQSRVSELDIKVTGLSQKQKFGQQNIERIQGEIHRFRREEQEILENLEQIALDIENKREDIVKIEKTIQESENTLGENEGILNDAIASREELSQKQKGFFHTREELAERMNSLDKEVFRLNSQSDKLKEESEAQINYMWDEYELTLSAARGLRNEELTDLSQIRRSALSLKEQIRKLGDVNVNAIEDYKNLMERYDFLKGQRDDLVKAEETLNDIIRELDEAMRKQFSEKFGEISRQFDKVFKELFGGGKGTLELVEDEDILEAGIRIIAQPPGKKLQNMMQLSGGEKALTAIALLFAIQNLKPSPFCLLDEIEAALDDSNVGRFAGYLRKLTKNTQFIVITHRRGTMEKADRLYGITMQEKGVSALVSVDLIDKELDA